MNNLYGGAMSQKMPFKLIGEVDIKLEVVYNEVLNPNFGQSGLKWKLKHLKFGDA